MQWEEFSFAVRYLSESDQACVERAFHMAEAAHAGQTRKSGDPYFSHPVAVARILADLGGDRDTIIAGLLHDTVEDTPVTLADIVREFGEPVGMLIDGLTKLGSVDVAGNPNLNEQIETLRKMFTLMQQDVRIMVIKLADRLHNMQTIQFRSHEKQVKVARETMDVYVKIAERLCMRDLQNTLESLCLAVLEPEMHAKLQELRTEREARENQAIETLANDLSRDHPQAMLGVTVRPEQKTWSRLAELVRSEGDSGQSITTVIAAIVCTDLDQCYRVMGALHQQWQREILSFQDFINSPMINGYRGLHTTIILEDGTRVRCKIRTGEMDRYARLGISIFCFDSRALGPLDYLPWTRTIATISTDTRDRSEEFWEGLQSDILKETITIYGPDDRSVQVPKGSTALDGAYFLLRDQANMTKGIFIKGRSVPFNTELKEGMTLVVDTATDPTVRRDWLHSVETNYATALIRTYLEQSSKDELRDIGRTLLQEALRERGNWYVEEFADELLGGLLGERGYHTADEAYEAIAGGRLDTADVVEVLTNGMRRRTAAPVQTTVEFDAPSAAEGLSLLERITRMYGQGDGPAQSSMRSTDHGVHVSFRALLSTERAQALKKDLVASGALQVLLRSPMRGTIALMLLVVFFWSLNPVIARWFLLHGVTPVALLTTRSLSFFVLATVFLATWASLRGSILSPIRHGTRLALLPALSSILLTFTTYLSLSSILPSVHLTILRLNVFALPLLALARGTVNRRVALLGGGIAAAGIAALAVHPSSPPIGVAFATVSLLAYMLYSHLSERTMQKAKIGIRYPFFLFQMGWIFGLVGVALLPFIDMSSLTPSTLLHVFFYTLFCVFVPHTCFHAVLHRTQFSRITNLSLLEVPLAIVFEITFLGATLLPIEYGIIVGILLCAALLSSNRAALQRTASAK